MRYSQLLVICLVVLLGAAAAHGGPITMVNSGPSSNRVDIVFMGDGYTSADLGAGTYVDHINSYLAHMFSPAMLSDPFHRYRNYFNVHRIDVVSNQSGADVPPFGVFRDTALGASYYYDRVTDRLLYVDQAKANIVLAAGLAGASFAAEMRFVTVNDTRYGGGGGLYSVYAGGHPRANELALHEMAHSFSRLADEYGGSHLVYTGPEPVEVNVTKDPSGAKWSRWFGYDQPIVGPIGVYEGARYYNHGLYRPSVWSKMTTLGVPFNAVGREKIILDIYALTDPLDDWLDNSTTLLNPEFLWVDTIDPDVIEMQWYVDGVLVSGATGERFDPRDFEFGPGTYKVRARAFDPTGFDPVSGWVRMNQSSLEEIIEWTVLIADVPTPMTGMLAALGFLLSGVVVRRRASSWGRGVDHLEASRLLDGSLPYRPSVHRAQARAARRHERNQVLAAAHAD